jgi:hypothetical protein
MQAKSKPVHLHHIDEDPANSSSENLAVLCFDCHHDTQTRGGFDRKLDAHQVKLYRTDWFERVACKRDAEGGPKAQQPDAKGYSLKYLQLRESNEVVAYSFSADYALIGTPDPASDAEINLQISAFVTTLLQRFRDGARAGSAYKDDIKKSGSGIYEDGMWISHSIGIFSPKLLSIKFDIGSYGAGAAHPNHSTRTLNFQLSPALEMTQSDIFRPRSNYLEILSAYCIADLSRQQPARWSDSTSRAEWLRNHTDEWIANGASPKQRNFDRLLLRRNGIVVHFDPYQVGSYSEGAYEVVVPLHILEDSLREDVYMALC